MSVPINREVSVSWIVENLGGSFLDDQPDCLEDVEEGDVTLRFYGKGSEEHFAAFDEQVEVTVPGHRPTMQRMRLPAQTFLNVEEGWLIITLPDGTTVRRWYETDADEDSDWIVDGGV